LLLWNLSYIKNLSKVSTIQMPLMSSMKD